MRAGALRHSVSIQRKIMTTDSHGGPVEAWDTVCTTNASIEPLQGREFIAAQAVNAETTGRIRMRYRSGIVPAMRVIFGTRVFNIQSVINPEERNRELILMVSEGLNEG